MGPLEKTKPLPEKAGREMISYRVTRKKASRFGLPAAAALRLSRKPLHRTTAGYHDPAQAPGRRTELVGAAVLDIDTGCRKL